MGGFAPIPDDVAGSMERSAEALSRVLDALARLRAGEMSSTVLMHGALEELCRAGDFGRGLMSWVRGSLWLPEFTFPPATLSDPMIADLLEREIPLGMAPVEAEVVRRRLPALVLDAAADPKVHSTLAVLTNEYVVAPLVVDGSAVGLIHVDTGVSGRPLTMSDRELVRFFSQNLGLIYERLIVAEELQRQREALDRAFRESRGLIAELASPVPTLRQVDPAAVGTATRGPDRTETNLTQRELEVLTLLADGLANRDIAGRLGVSESTIKSHVKHILRKLGVSNRAGAIAAFGRLTRQAKEEWK
jgi:DNA-binding CsgD family transcriptional regulator